MPSLFVYGTLIPGSEPPSMTGLVERFKVIGAATLPGRLFDLGDYPGLVQAPGALVQGMLVELPDDPMVLLKLDAYEGFDASNPAASLFRREAASVTLDTDGQSIECLVYVYNRPTSGQPLIADGRWHRRQIVAPRHSSPSAKRPIIGITIDASEEYPARYESPSDYAKSVERAGGLPILLPYRTDLALIHDYADLVDGVLFTGGSDLDPALYGQERHPKAVPIDPDRQKFELALIAEIERRRLPALGVCLGSQLMNVHRGGSLVQFLPEVGREHAIEHRHLGDSAHRHAVHIEPGTILSKSVGRGQIEVNSRHKQAVNTLGRGLTVNARAPDGVIEGFEDPSLPLFLAVQWHPENLAAAMPEHLQPFKLLVEKAATTKSKEVS